MKSFHDCVHTFDDGYQSEFISELMTDGFEDEQVWQQQELQLDSAKRSLMETFSITNIEEAHVCFERKSVRNESKINGTSNEKTEEKEEGTDGDSDVDDLNSDINSTMDSEESDRELQNIKERIKNRENDGFDAFGDEDISGEDDTLFQGAEEDDEEEDDNDIDFDFDLPPKEKETVAAKKAPAVSSKSKRKTEVDDKFFKLADMEEFLLQEDQKEEKKQKKGGHENETEDTSESDGETSDIDMFSQWPEEETSKV